MKAQDWKRIMGPLLPTAEGWAHRGKLAYRVPVKWVLVGVLGESSGFAPRTYVDRTSTFVRECRAPESVLLGTGGRRSARHR
jgi:hypothetical protein